MALGLGEVEIRTPSSLDQLLGVVKEVETEIHQGTRHRCRGSRGVTEAKVGFIKMPTPWSHHDGGRVLTEGVRTTVRRDIVDSSADGIEERELTADDIGPRRTGGVLLIGQPHPSTRVQCIDRHSAIGRTRDLHATVLETGSGAGDAPRQVLSDHPGPGQEVEPATVLDPLSTLVSL